ncbi:biotin-dependent carboxyltransferase family protein [Aeromicrobium sp. Root472D3]|uniref:5-oxoprolinase subunit C family protein n=1 Tax=Aeromicrobium sp. Root472D3 TaxID=1736540 RepID=UPI001F1D8283|nr:biotin-dependent carboxyltransferase family protein [Aeromicrobium sp. Root472D3]
MTVVTPGPFATVQDLGRRGYSRYGVGRSGAVDRTSFALANRLVGNAPEAAALEVTMGGLSVLAHHHLYVAVTGADACARVDGVLVGHHTAFVVEAGQILTLDTPTVGVRTYVAVRGGIGVDAVLGSRSTDTLAGLGPEVLRPGAVLPAGNLSGRFPSTDFAPVATPTAGHLTVDFRWGPRDSWFTADALSTLCAGDWRVDAASNRVGVRLQGPRMARARHEELPSEGVATGSIQVPPSGPIVFLDDHPVTGGYPVVGVVDRASLDRVAQVRPGQVIRFRPVDRTSRRRQHPERTRP